jgi:hypothetical protein
MRRLASIFGPLALLASAAVTQAGTIRADKADSLYTTLAANYPSVGRITWTDGAFSYLASGTLIAPNWVLTAGHVTDGKAVTNMTVLLNGASYSAAEIIPNPSWNGDLNHGFDIGLVRLTQNVVGVTPADRLTTSNEKGKLGTSVGYGLTGTGKTGYQDSNIFTKRAGNNQIDAYGSAVGMPNHFMLSDFDDPSNKDHRNLFGSATPLPLEYCIAPGDSGGGTFVTVNGKTLLAGVHSFISTMFKPLGDGTLNSSYSDYFGSTRVSLFNDWINSTMNAHFSQSLAGSSSVLTLGSTSSTVLRSVSTTVAVPEAGSVLMAAIGLASLVLTRQRQRGDR